MSVSVVDFALQFITALFVSIETNEPLFLKLNTVCSIMNQAILWNINAAAICRGAKRSLVWPNDNV